jgi:UDP-3-O-[3-hydroxymyristoyl] N-acetylglucosamine deacetylase
MALGGDLVTQPVVVSGVGLHSGASVRVTLMPHPGPVILASPDAEATLDDLTVASTARATTVESRDGRLRVGTVEHLFAALAGLAVHSGLRMLIEGPEMPLLDGGARAWCEALARLPLATGRPALRIAREAAYDIGPSRFELSPGDRVEVAVHVDLGDPRLDAEARWTGEAEDFVQRIAPARTFTLSRDVEELVRRGLARHVDPACVVVLTPTTVLHAGRPFAPDEPARHKLLDLMGDLYLHGGPPLGRFRAIRPGHASNARAIRRALDEGVLVRGTSLSGGKSIPGAE